MALALVMATTVVAAPAPASATPAGEARMLALTNQLRASAGVTALALDGEVSAVARAWAQQMASDGNISHNPNYGSQIDGWSSLAENVGMGTGVDAVHQALAASAVHRANLVSPDFTLIGIGVVDTGTMVFVVQNFVRPAAAAARAPAPAPVEAPAARRPAPPPPRRSPPPTPAPAPEAAPADEPAAPVAERPSPSPTLTFVLDTLRTFDRSVRR